MNRNWAFLVPVIENNRKGHWWGGLPSVQYAHGKASRTHKTRKEASRKNSQLQDLILVHFSHEKVAKWSHQHPTASPINHSAIQRVPRSISTSLSTQRSSTPRENDSGSFSVIRYKLTNQLQTSLMSSPHNISFRGCTSAVSSKSSLRLLDLEFGHFPGVWFAVIKHKVAALLSSYCGWESQDPTTEARLACSVERQRCTLCLGSLTTIVRVFRTRIQKSQQPSSQMKKLKIFLRQTEILNVNCYEFLDQTDRTMRETHSSWTFWNREAREWQKLSDLDREIRSKNTFV